MVQLRVNFDAKDLPGNCITFVSSKPNPCLTTQSNVPIKSPAGGLGSDHSAASLLIHLVYLSCEIIKCCLCTRSTPVCVFVPQSCCLCCVWESCWHLCSSFHFSLCFWKNQDKLHQPLKINPRLQYVLICCKSSLTVYATLPTFPQLIFPD